MKQNILDNSKLALLEVWKNCNNNNRIIKKKKKKKEKHIKGKIMQGLRYHLQPINERLNRKCYKNLNADEMLRELPQD